jgi:hypothetical protein
LSASLVALLVPTHIIRLRGPWDCEPLESESLGQVRHTRRFGFPTNLSPQERVWLVIEGAACRGAAALNDKPLGAIAGEATAEFDVTDQLRPRNVLRIDIDLPQNESRHEQFRDATIGEVRLEIRS